MNYVSIAWGCGALLATLAPLIPQCEAVSPYNIPFAVVGIVVSGDSFIRSGARRKTYMAVGLVLSACSALFSLIWALTAANS